MASKAESASDDDANTLLTFLHSTCDSSATAVATPLTLWRVVQALARTCVALTHQQPSATALGAMNSRIDGLRASITEAVQRLTTAELIMEKMHFNILQNSNTMNTFELNASVTDESLARTARKFDAQISEMKFDLERLQRGVERHAEFVNEQLAAAVTHRSVAAVGAEGPHPQAPPRRDALSFGVAVCQTHRGVEVVSVSSSSIAQLGGILSKDLILSIGGNSIELVSDIGKSLECLTMHQNTFVVRVFRENRLESLMCNICR